jgi:hypothetical protein
MTWLDNIWAWRGRLLLGFAGPTIAFISRRHRYATRGSFWVMRRLFRKKSQDIDQESRGKKRKSENGVAQKNRGLCNQP